MSASLVGSEMCIRDSLCTACGASMDPPALGLGVQEQLGRAGMLADGADPCLVRPLSYESID
eukprot:9402899-Alexandrium_andersonii.AAC.1